MTTPPLAPPQDLIEEYKRALVKVKDLRLFVLLWFNVFEEIMRIYAAWRLTCDPRCLPTTSSPVFDLVVMNGEHSELRGKISLLLNLRNEVAHKFHKRVYKPKLNEFIKAATGKNPSSDESKRQREFSEAVVHLALDIAQALSAIPQRGDELPIPVWALTELESEA